MNPFLHTIANVFYSEYGQDISGFSFVFPNKRAGLFFQKYLAQIIEKPVFSPEIFTVNEVFHASSNLKAADRTDLLFRLYRIYKNITSSDESFDSFLGWGEILLNDFDDVDKYLIDAKQIFRNIKELNEIDSIFDFINEQQKAAIERFWKHFVPVSEAKKQQEFIAAWRVLLPMYEEFRVELLKQNLGTEAMVFKEVTEAMKSNKSISFLEKRDFVFVGFNALNPCEKTFFTELKKRGKADFYWDYEASELQDTNNPASIFFKTNTLEFPSKLKFEKETPEKKEFELISIPSEVGQAKHVYQLLQNVSVETDKKDWIKTAVVLPNENLLLPLLYSLPQEIENVNVTMGFPIKYTSVSGLIEHIFDLQKRTRKSGENALFYFQNVLSILHHQYIQLLCNKDIETITSDIINNNRVYIEESAFKSNNILKTIFTFQNQPEKFMEYLLEVVRKLQQGWQTADLEKKSLESDFLYQYFTVLNRLNDLLQTSAAPENMTIDVLMRIIRQLTGGITIPFEGEPLQGLQVMGMLETRGLDFENLIICSFNEGIFPKRNSANSFIPYNLRKAFDLPTSDNQDAVSAYNFYRLIYRAKRVFFLYDCRTDGGLTGEVSRFAYQLKYHYGVDLNEKNISFDIHFPEPQLIMIQKTPEVMEKLERFVSGNIEGKAFSASSINNYVDCPLKFYLSQLETIKEVEEVEEDIEATMFGTLMHTTMQFIYEPFEGKTVQVEDLEDIIKHPVHIEKLIRKAFAQEYFKKDKDTVIELEGNYLLTGKVLEKYIKRMLEFDKQKAPFLYIKSEDKCYGKLSLFDGRFSVNLKGFIDRVEQKDGIVNVIDYKSGSGELGFKSLEAVFESGNKNRPKYVLQTFLYCLLLKEERRYEKVVPSIYYVKSIFKNDFSTQIIYKPDRIIYPVEDMADYEKEFKEKLTSCVEEIYTPEIPFTQCKDPKICEHCEFNVICRKA